MILKKNSNSRPSASNFKSFSRSLEQFFLTVSQNNFGNKIPFLYLFQIIYLIMIFINTVKNLLNLILTIYEVQKNGQRYDSLSGFGFKFFTKKSKKLPTYINLFLPLFAHSFLLKWWYMLYTHLLLQIMLRMFFYCTPMNKLGISRLILNKQVDWT